MKRLIVLVLIGALCWSGFWGFNAWRLSAAVDGWFEARRAEGWQAEYDTRQLRGFPNRLDLRFEGLALADPSTGFAYEADQLQVLRLVYNPSHFILVFGPSQRLSTPRGDTRLASAGLKASLRQSGTGRGATLAQINAEAESLSISGPGGTIALADLRAALAQGSEPEVYTLAVAAAALAGSTPTVEAADGLALEARVRFDAPWTLSDFEGTRPQPRHLDLTRAEYHADDLLLRLAGDLTIDKAGVPEGDMTLRAENWRSLIDKARNEGQLNAALLDGVEDALSLVARMMGREDRLDLPLRLQGGQTYLGPFPLGPAPRLQLP